MDKMKETDRSNIERICITGVQEEDKEQNHTPDQPLTTTDVWEEYEQDTKCGIGRYKPRWLQKLASKKSYVFVYGLVGLCYSAGGTYFVSTISTIEKRFKIPSRTTGTIITAVDISGLFASLTLAYLGSRGHKTRWLAIGTIMVALSCFLRLLPHLIYGPGQDALVLTVEHGGSYDAAIDNGSLNKNLSEAFLCRSEQKYQEECSAGDFSSAPAAIFFVSFLIFGVGASVYHTLGISYLDDNARKNKAPFLLAIWHCIRMVGPTLGFLYGSYALHMYVAPSAHPTITSDDPRWIGAWWHAWGPFGVMNLLLAVVLALFPKKLPRAAQREVAAIAAGISVSNTKERSFSDFKMVLRRLTKNKVLLFNSFSSVFFMFGYIGYWLFMPKYLETQFRQSAAKSSLITGSLGISCSALGIIVSGVVITKFKPRSRYIAAWNVFVEVLDVIGHLCYGFLTCSVDDLHGEWKPDNSWTLTVDCNNDCDCGPNVKYSPICAADGSKTFFSACHAGCTSVEMINGTKMYGNCSCIGPEGTGWAVDGSCPVDCSAYFTMFLVLQCIMRFCAASGRSGNMIIQFRCVAEDDKSASIGFTEVLLCALAFIPGPIVYGMLLDSACIVWGQTCGEVGNCWLYDEQTLGYLLNFITSGFLLCGTFLDIGVWYYVKDLQIYDKETETEGKKGEKQ